MANELVIPSATKRNADILRDEESYATALIAVLADKYTAVDEESPDPFGWLDWEPETWRLQIAQDFGVTISEFTLKKILVGSALIRTDRFTQDVAAFIHFCNILSGSNVSMDQFDPAMPDEIGWAIIESMLLWPAEEKDFSPEVLGYIQEVHKMDNTDPGSLLREILLGEYTDNDPDWSDDDPETALVARDGAQQEAAAISSRIVEMLQELQSQMEYIELSQGGSVDDVIRKIEILLQSYSTESES